jgi:hypothetical protein
MKPFTRKPSPTAHLELGIMAQERDAAGRYIAAFLDGEVIDRDYVLRALALLAHRVDA